MALSRMIARLAAAVAALLLGIGAASACEPIHVIKRIPGADPGTVLLPRICWAGPCQNQVGVVDSLGRFYVSKRLDEVVDHITMRMENGPLRQVLVSRSREPVCDPPASTVGGCTERFRLRMAKACPLGMAPCPVRDKKAVNLTSLDQVNTLTTGGSITLSDGQVVTGVPTSAFWLYYEVCCPDTGQFGAVGTEVHSESSYTTRIDQDAGSCRVHDVRDHQDEIPDKNFPCP